MSITEEERKILTQHRILKAINIYDDAVFAFDAGRYSTAANRLYYALFHACGALLLSIGIETNRHSGMRAMVGMHFIKTGILNKDDSALLYDVFTIRQQCDYDDFVDINKERIETYIFPVKDLILRIANLLNVTTEI